MEIFKKPLTYLKRHKSRNLAVKTPIIDLKPVTKTKHVSNAGVSFHSLPAELQHTIYIYALSNLEIRISLEGSDSSSPNARPVDQNEEHTGHTYVISPTSLFLLDFYQTTLFPLAADWHDTPWEPHVLFIFPSALSLLDLLTSPSWPRSRLTLIRRLRVHDHHFFHSNGEDSRCYGPLDVLPLLSHQGLTLDLLEYAPTMPLQQYANDRFRLEFDRVLTSPSWTTLHVISLQTRICWSEPGVLLTCFLRQLPYLSRLGELTLELPGQLILTTTTAHQTVGVSGADCKVTGDGFWDWMSVPDRMGWEKWVSGEELSVGIVARRETHFVVGCRWDDWMKRRENELCALLEDREKWVEKRRSGKVRDCYRRDEVKER